jgi:hypothetical protein
MWSIVYALYDTALHNTNIYAHVAQNLYDISSSENGTIYTGAYLIATTALTALSLVRHRVSGRNIG